MMAKIPRANSYRNPRTVSRSGHRPRLTRIERRTSGPGSPPGDLADNLADNVTNTSRTGAPPLLRRATCPPLFSEGVSPFAAACAGSTGHAGPSPGVPRAWRGHCSCPAISMALFPPGSSPTAGQGYTAPKTNRALSRQSHNQKGLPTRTPAEALPNPCGKPLGKPCHKHKLHAHLDLLQSARGLPLFRRGIPGSAAANEPHWSGRRPLLRRLRIFAHRED
jgi:hypothetical protein